MGKAWEKANGPWTAEKLLAESKLWPVLNAGDERLAESIKRRIPKIRSGVELVRCYTGATKVAYAKHRGPMLEQFPTIDRCDPWDAHRMSRKINCVWSPKKRFNRKKPWQNEMELEDACSLAIPNIASFKRQMNNVLPEPASGKKAVCGYVSKLEKCLFRMNMKYIDGDTVAFIRQ